MCCNERISDRSDIAESGMCNLMPFKPGPPLGEVGEFRECCAVPQYGPAGPQPSECATRLGQARLALMVRKYRRPHLPDEEIAHELSSSNKFKVAGLDLPTTKLNIGCKECVVSIGLPYVT